MTALPHTTVDGIPSLRPVRFSALSAPKPPAALAKVLTLRPMERITTKGFLALLGSLLTASMLLMLALNTLLAQGSFARYDLMTRKSEVSLRETALAEQLMQVESPAQLTKRARAMGMVPNTAPGYIDAQTGTVTGAALPAQVPVSLPGLSAVPGTATVAGTPDAAALPGPGGESAVGLRPGSVPTAGATAGGAAPASPETGGAAAALAANGQASGSTGAGGEAGLGLRAGGGAR